ncbi:MAG: hypothetical protein HYU88_03795 [Chloroflexi bacterium]|nr:hypothetical protein [Chloroflexota bacterium]
MLATPLHASTDRVQRAVVAGFSATVVLLTVYLAGYALVHLFALVAPAASLSHRFMAEWLQALVQNRLVDPAQPTLYVALGLQVVVAMAGWLRGLLFALVLWVGTLLVALPLLGAGVLGVDIGAGPLPTYTTLLAYLAYGVILSLAYAARDDIAASDEAVPPTLLRGAGWNRTAAGIAVGALLGAATGLALGTLVPWQGGVVPGGLAPVALMMVLALAGAGLGELVGSLAALPAEPHAQPLARVGLLEERLPLAAEAVPAFVAPGRLIRVVAAHGACQLGYRPGQTFRCSAAGQLEPGVCAAAQDALRPLLCAMVEGRPDAPQQVACPIYDHMLVFAMAEVA